MVVNKTEIRIIAANCQGLNDYKKRKDVFQYYRQQCNILCVVDTHFTGEMKNEMNGVSMHTLVHTHQSQEE